MTQSNFWSSKSPLDNRCQKLEIVDLSSALAEVQKNELRYGEKKLGFWELQGF